ncbi:adenylate kinase 8-like [Macrosteles quadrilineatus]|uniref:adenylate kinase 8-like n=1 Tax=Macrosteles quadrilineatus TaxID=74068 RepID=UPI0023E28FCD|nr:adenylate kinase 8-like [Macrosteles quadrilineatus]
MAVDESMRTLKIPPRFTPYLEKHRIYELFYDLGNELAINRPSDPLLFLKTRLEQVDKWRDKRIIVMITPPSMDRIKLSQLVSAKSGCSILSRYLCVKNPVDHYSPIILAKAVSDTLEESDEKDWIFADFPDTAEEAEELITLGVLPTHTLLLLEDNNNVDEEEAQTMTLKTSPSVLMDYDNNAYHLKELYKSSLKVVKVKNKSLEDVAEACSILAKKMPCRPAPRLFRVALIGPRGSRRRTLAKLVSKQFNVVHVDMEQLVNAARVADTASGDELRYLDKNGFSYPLKTVFDLLKNRLAKEDCINRGYVLTNFPTSVDDFVLLDSIETPPNRVVFLDVDEAECQKRLENRLVNMHTGSLHYRSDDQSNPENLTHPDDQACKVENEIMFYNERIEAIKDYCGETASIVDARGPINSLLERIEDILMSPAPVTKPRSGNSTKKHNEPRKSGSEASSGSRRLYTPISRTEVVPMIESVELLRRFSELKMIAKGRSDSSSTDDGDLIMRELDKEFERALRGGRP